MAVRNIEYTVSADGINPSVMQKGGVQGDHRATELVFTIEDGLWTTLGQKKTTEGGRLIYRFDAFGGDGNGYSSDIEELTGKTLKYPLEEFLTRVGGIVRVVLVISHYKNDSTVMELYSFPAVLSIRGTPDVHGGQNRESMSVLADIIKQAAVVAEEAKRIAVEAKEQTLRTRAYLDGGAEFIFNGGDSESEIDVDFVIDNAMSDTSENAIMNKIVKAYIDNLYENLLLAAHPVGSLYWSSENEDPNELFGGRWERIKGAFIYAVYDQGDENDDSIRAGSSGGHATVTLNKNQLPKHIHRGLYRATETPTKINLTGTSASDTGYALTGINGAVYVPSSIYVGENDYDAGVNEQQPINIMPPYVGYYCWRRLPDNEVVENVEEEEVQ